MCQALTALLILAAGAAEPEPIRIAAPSLNFVQIDADKGDFFLDYFSQQLGAQEIRLTTAREISALVGFERQKELLGCSDASSSCLAELAGALGVDGILTGSIARTERGFTVTLRVLGARDAAPIASDSARVADEDALLDWLGEAARRMAPRIHAAFGRLPAPAQAALTQPPSPPADPGLAGAGFAARFGRADVWGPLAAGLVLGVTGSVLELQAQGIWNDLALGNEVPETRSALDDRLAQGGRMQLYGNAAWVGGAVALGIFGWRLLTPTGPPRVALQPTAGGALLTVGGVLP